MTCGNCLTGASARSRLLPYAWAVFAACWLLPSPLRADVLEENETYIEALQRDGFPDLAIDYLRMLEQRTDTPAAIKKNLDYELGQALMAAAEVGDPETERKSHDEATKRFQRFLHANPTADSAIDSRNQLAYILLKRGQRNLYLADLDENPQKQAPLRLEARKEFTSAQQAFDKTIEQFTQVLAKRTAGAGEPENKVGVRARERLQDALIQARMNRAMVEYQIARTYDAKEPARNKSLAEAEKLFGAIAYDAGRNGPTIASIYSKLYQARAVLDGGDCATALDILEEVLATEKLGEGKSQSQVPVALRGLWTRARHSFYQALNAKRRFAEVVESPVYSAPRWIERNQASSRTPDGFGVQLEAGKAYIELAKAEPENSPARAKQFVSAQRHLNAVAKTLSPYQATGLKLRNEYAKDMKAVGKPATFDEAMEVAGLLRDAKKWREAADAYEEALALVKPRSDPERAVDAGYWVAFSRFQEGDMAAAAAVGEKLVKERARAKKTPLASQIALSALWEMYRTLPAAQRNEKAAARLFDLAKSVEGLYPELSVADVARRTRGSALLQMRKYDEAAVAFAAVAPQSPAYGEAQFRFAQCRILQYNQQIKAKQRNDAVVKQHQTEALAALQTSSQALRTELYKPDASNQPVDKTKVVMPAMLIESELTWAEFARRTGDPATAAKLIDPLIPVVLQGDRKDLDALTTRLLLAGLEVARDQQDFIKADRLVEQIVKQKSENPAQITASLVGLGKRLEAQYQAQLKDEKEKEKAAGTLDLLNRFLKRMADRPQQDYRGVRYVADAYFALGGYAAAAEQYSKLIETLKGEPKDVPAANRVGETYYVRMQHVASLRQAGEFAKAAELIDAFLGELAPQPGQRAYFPLRQQTEKGRILQAWGEKDAAQLKPALAQWNFVLRAVQPMRQKPLEYFEGRLGVAACLARMGQKEEAAKVLRGTLAIYPTAGSPEFKTKYDDLLKTVE